MFDFCLGVKLRGFGSRSNSPTRNKSASTTNSPVRYSISSFNNCSWFLYPFISKIKIFAMGWIKWSKDKIKVFIFSCHQFIVAINLAKKLITRAKEASNSFFCFCYLFSSFLTTMLKTRECLSLKIFLMSIVVFQMVHSENVSFLWTIWKKSKLRIISVLKVWLYDTSLG